jgi:transcriptional regulator with XRE-family HTH domain
MDTGAVQCFYEPKGFLDTVFEQTFPIPTVLLAPTYPVQPSSVGEHLRKKRLDISLSQADVAKRLRVNEASVWNWENNRSCPSIRLIPRVIDFLGYVPDDSKPESLGQRIIAFRRLRGLTRKELARRLGVDPTTLAKWERGERRPPAELLNRLTGFAGHGWRARLNDPWMTITGTAAGRQGRTGADETSGHTPPTG